MKFSSILILILSAMVLASCGRGDLKVKLKEGPSTDNKQTKRFRMSTQESLIDKYPVMEEVDLYELVPHLDSLPIDYDSFMEIYHALELKGTTIQSRYVILKKDPSCTSDVGYCHAVFINR